MRDRLQRRINRSLARRAEHRLLPSRATADSRSAHWRACLDDAGVELERVLHVRPDTRGVFLARHPEIGRCMLKTVSDTQHPHRAFTQLSVGQWLLEHRPTVFPEILRATSAYTLERYVSGRPFRDWLESDFDDDVIAEYFAGLRALVPPRGIYRWGEPMGSDELVAVCQTYLRKCLRHSRYFGFRHEALSSVRVLRGSGRLSRRIDRLLDRCAVAQVPRTLMCGDMGNVNILVQDSPCRVVNVDYEFLGPGHWGFDVAYFLSSLAKWDRAPEQVRRITELAFDDVGLDPSARELFLELTDVLSDVSRTVYLGVAHAS